MIGLAAISTRLNVFTPRYIMGSIPAYMILLGSLLHSRKWHTAPAYLLLIGWIAVNSISLQNAFTNQKAPDWRQIARFLQQNTITGDLVIQTGVDAAFGYYFAAVDVPAQEVALPASAAQPVSEIIAFLQTAQQDYASLWITGKTIAGWSNNGVVESWAQQNLQLVRELFIDGVPIRQFKLYTPNLTEYGSPRVTFGATVALLGAAVQPISIDQQLVLWTYWQPLQPSNNSLKLFLHLTGDTNAAGSTLWQQDDHFPLAGLVDSRTWQPPSVIRDVSRVALHELPAGSYTLQIGWYDPVTLARLQTETGADSFLLGTLTINEKKEAVFNPPPD
jgi:hypothetical protein